MLVATAHLTTGRTLPNVSPPRPTRVEADGAAQLVAAARAPTATTGSPLRDRIREQQRALRKLVQQKQPQLSTGAWLLISALLAADSVSREEKHRGLVALREKMQADDYHIAIVTTAALPWMTGTAVNPLLRAAYLAKAGRRVTLCVPWLHPLDQALVFSPKHGTFATPAEQEAHIRAWLVERGGVSSAEAEALDLRWYPSRLHRDRGSILPLGDTTACFSRDESDVVVLEEPEHLNWYHFGHNWRRRFKLSLGIVHTNYIGYARMYEPQLVPTIRTINKGVCRAYCDAVVKLSDTLQVLPRASVCNVHGVRDEFLAAGRKAASPRHRFRRGAYFIGKVLWAKGHRLLIEYLAQQAAQGAARTTVDVYGSGEDLEQVKAAAEKEDLALSFQPPTDHADPRLREYKVFVNPSQTEVLSTTTAEALAMGKFVVVQRHPSNAFFMDFANTLAYDTPEQFLQALEYALASTPAPLSAAEQRRLSWEGATERFVDTLANCTAAAPMPNLLDRVAWWAHACLSCAPGVLGDVMRAVSGGGPVSRQSWTCTERYRDARSTTQGVTELVERSVAVSPPQTEWWRETAEDARKTKKK